MSSPTLLRESSPSLSRERLGLVLGFIGMAIFGGTLPATRIAVAAIDPLALTALRTAIAGVCSLVLVIVLRRKFPPRHLWFQLAVASICVVILFPFLMALAVQTVDAAHGGVVMGALPIATAFVAVLITHERPKPLFWIASLAGAGLVVAFALPLSLPAAALTLPADIDQIALKPWLALLYVALFPQWIGFFAWNAGL